MDMYFTHSRDSRARNLKHRIYTGVWTVVVTVAAISMTADARIQKVRQDSEQVPLITGAQSIRLPGCF
jgi:hypothetical protein